MTDTLDRDTIVRALDRLSQILASRIPAGPEDQGDVADIAVLIRRLGLGDADQALSIVARYYPEEQIPVRARYLIEDLFTRMAEG